MTTEYGWCFDPVPPSGARQGGDPAQFVFEPDVDALVRETLQNSNDQVAAGSDRVEVQFRLHEYRGRRLEVLRKRFGLDDLARHLSSIEQARSRFEAGLEMLQGDVLTGLWIEDRGTTGLTGEEHGSGNFAALCRDRLFSEKQRAESGGSFGLGKAVLWRFSHLSTVAFYSRIAVDGESPRQRFIIKAALPYHRLADGQECSGDGWYGRLEAASDVRAVSLWDLDAMLAATALGAREFGQDETGTSILILGFGDPAEEADEDPVTLRKRLADAARSSFWPALSQGRLAVQVGPDLVSPHTGVEGRLSRMLERYHAGGASKRLEDVDDLVVERIRVELPSRKDGRHGKLAAEGDVIVSLVEEGDPHAGMLWAFRGPSMIIEQRKLRPLSLSQRPYVAILVCGEAARGEPAYAPEFEKYLQTAEPPAHDRWTATPRLRELYNPGWKVALQRLWEATEAAIREHVVVPQEASDGGPERLRRLFRAGVVGGGKSTSEFHFRQLDARVRDGAWHFSGEVRRNTPTKTPWRTIIDLEFPEERGRGREGGTLAQVDVEGATCEVRDGRAHVSAPADTAAIRIHGITDPERHPVPADQSAIELVFVAQVAEDS